MKRGLFKGLKDLKFVLTPVILEEAFSSSSFRRLDNDLSKLFSNARIKAKFSNIDVTYKKEIQEVISKFRSAAITEITRRRYAFESKTVAILNSLTLNPAGQNVLHSGLPYFFGTTFAVHSGLTVAPVFGRSTSLSQLTFPRSHTYRVKESNGLLAIVNKEIRVWIRAITLWLIFAPVILLAPLSLSLGWGRTYWMSLLRWSLEKSGPAFIKWGQWGATRPDLFPVDLCRALESLHNKAPQHTFQESKREIEKVFGLPLDMLFIDFEEKPVASGSIAQVHKARIAPLTSACAGVETGTEVAIKVRHPGVDKLMEMDFKLMTRACNFLTKLPYLSHLRLDESIRQFGAPFHEQLDLSLEADNLDRFNRNFKFWRNVSFPVPVRPLVTPSVLVESFEHGELISRYVKNPNGDIGVKISQTGLDLFLKMLVKDNFMHADMHPGNILVKNVNHEGLGGWISKNLFFGKQPKLVLLDAGMITELTPQDQRNILGFFKAITAQDGANVAHNILELAVNPTCPNPGAFVQDMKDLFDGLDLETIRKYTSQVIQEMLEKVRIHQVTLKGSVSTLVATTLVLEGWSTELNPDIRIMDQLKDALPQEWNERFLKTIEKIEALGYSAEYNT